MEIERAAWLVMLVGILAAALGAFGGGLLSSAPVGRKEQLAIEYDRFPQPDISDFPHHNSETRTARVTDQNQQ